MTCGPTFSFLSAARNALFALSLALGASAAYAQTTQQQTPAPQSQVSSSAPTPVEGWQQRLGVLRIGVLAPHYANRKLLKLRPFQRHLQDRLGVRIELFPVPDEPSLMQALSEGRIDYAPLSTSAYIALRGYCKCVDPIVMPARLDGSTSFRVALFADRSVGSSLAELKGATIAVPGRHSFAGYAAPKSLMRDRGIGFENAQWNILDEGSPLAAARALVKGKAAALLGWVGHAEAEAPSSAVDTRALLRAMSDKTNYSVIWMSPPIHHAPHVVRSALPLPARKALQTTLATLSLDHRAIYKRLDPIHGGGLKPSAGYLYDDIAAAILRASTSVADTNQSPVTVQ